MARYGLSWDPRPQTLGHCPDPALLPLGTVSPKWHGVGQRRQDWPESARAHVPRPPTLQWEAQPEPRIQSLPGKRAFPWSSSAMMQPTDQMSTEAEGVAISLPTPSPAPESWGLGPRPHGHIQALS